MDTNFDGNVERFSGYADHYDQHRPQPPASLASLLMLIARCTQPALVVDLGSGTGLSTRYWSDKALEVIGVEPSADMRNKAIARTSAPNVSYVAGLSHSTGFLPASAQVVTCMQALHWMEPQATFEEAARILQPGGVFAAIDYDWPPVTGSWEADAAWVACSEQIDALERRVRPNKRLKRWNKGQHLARMHDSKCFRYTREVVLHHFDEGNAERFIGLFLSQGSVMDLRKAGLSDVELDIDSLRTSAQQTLGSSMNTWIWSARVRVGIV